MSIVDEVTAVFRLLGKAWNLLRARLDPARVQAKRLIEAFEAYGIARQQIPRILPPELELPNTAFSTPDKLKDKVTPALLDWAAEYLAIKRSWLDCVDDTPHLKSDHYKVPARYRDWLDNRLKVAPDVYRLLTVWKTWRQDIPSGQGPFCVIYEEVADGLDGAEFSRYWLLSDHWIHEHHHQTCIESLIALIDVAVSLGVPVFGRDVPLAQLLQLEAGKRLVPDVVKHAQGKWYPEDLVKPLPGKDSEWRQARWRGAQGYLEREQ